jgi:GT2 family glycosyltransferase
LSEIAATVVVPTFNRDAVAASCVRDLLAQTHRPLEILIVDQSEGVSSQLKELAEHRPDIIRWHRVTFRGLPAARNYGWQHAAHQAIVFVDDDTRCPPQLVAEHIRTIQLPNVGVVAGAIEETEGSECVNRAVGAFRSWTATPLRGFDATGEREVDHAPGGNFSTWRYLTEHLCGFDERFQIGAALYEETDYCLRVKRAGFRIYFNGRARLAHLGAPCGGCRVRDVPTYVEGLAHNRAVLIRRHLRWYQMPTAILELSRLGAAYAVRYRRPAALLSCARGCLHGLRAGTLPPICRWHEGIEVSDNDISGAETLRYDVGPQ